MKNRQRLTRQSQNGNIGGRKLRFCCALFFLSLCAAGQAAESLPPTLSPNEILAHMERRYEQQLQALESYRDRRRYSVTHSLLGESTYLLVEEKFLAPEEKRFQVLERGGSSAVQQRVFFRLLQVEEETARESTRLQVDLCRRNYDFTFQQYDPTAGAYVFQVKPRSSNPYLLRGKVWINAEDFAVQRIEGEPAQRSSALIRQTHFVHEFAKFGDFWFSVRHRSETELFLFGRASLAIDYFDYHWQSR